VEELLPQVRDTGKILMEELRKLQTRHAVLGDVRGVGLMVGIEMVHPKTAAPAPSLVQNADIRTPRPTLLKPISDPFPEYFLGEPRPVDASDHNAVELVTGAGAE
jgi:hypothetical protein